jgi:CDGSH iron-sulfur domain-containing protein 3
MMSEPVIADTKPVVLELEADIYYWCSCGRSANQPFCNGAHKDTGFAPMKFEVAEKRSIALCNCKHTGNAPYCDGSHSKL